jgi:hypothetical protein
MRLCTPSVNPNPVPLIASITSSSSSDFHRTTCSAGPQKKLRA